MGGDTDARVGRRRLGWDAGLPPQHVLACMTCEWTSENPKEPHGDGCPNFGKWHNTTCKRNPSRIPASCQFEAGTEACKARQDALSKQIKEARTENAELRQRESILSSKCSACWKTVQKKYKERDEMITKLNVPLGGRRMPCQSGFMYDDRHDPIPLPFIYLPDCCEKRTDLEGDLDELFFYHGRLKARVEGTDRELKDLEDIIHDLTRECQKLQESLSELSTKGQREVNAPNMPSEERDQAENTWLEFWKTL